MTDNGRLIINHRGESAQVVRPLVATFPGHTVTLQVTVHYDALTPLALMSDRIPMGYCGELGLGQAEAMALLLKLADQLGVALEVPARPRAGAAVR